MSDYYLAYLQLLHNRDALMTILGAIGVALAIFERFGLPKIVKRAPWAGPLFYRCIAVLAVAVTIMFLIGLNHG